MITLNKVVFFDREPVHCRRFLSYVRSRSGLPFEMEGAMDSAECLRLCRKGDVTALLTDETAWREMPEREEILKKVKICCILTGEVSPGTQTAEVFYINRYQPVPGILEELKEKLETAGLAGIRDEIRASCTGVYAPAGAAGRTAVAMVCAGRMAEETSVLLVSFSAVPSFFLPVGEGKGGLSEILYSVKNEGRLNWRPQMTEMAGKLKIVLPVSNPEDLWDMTPSEMAAVLEEILKTCGCRKCVAEIPSGINPLPLLGLCDEILLVRDGTEDGRRGTEEFLTFLKGREDSNPADLAGRCREAVVDPCPELKSMSAGDPLFRYSRSAAEMRLPIPEYTRARDNMDAVFEPVG